MTLTRKFPFNFLPCGGVLTGASAPVFLFGVIMKLLDFIKERYKVKNDAELSRTLDVPPPTISKIRSGKVNVSADMILRIHECLGMSVADIRKLL